MSNKKHKFKRWHVVWVSELKYNPYRNVDEKKQRPVMIWNNSNELRGKIIAFYCTSKFDPMNPFLYCINSNYDNKIITYVDLRKIMVIKTSDVNWQHKWGIVKNLETREKVNQFIQKFFSIK